ncbi:hypothetical protein, partial [Rhodococcus sp. 852002-51564_SCH6189132-a]|uniref:hypothetical protein n=1 Tax=Rhodococcus sp. 852002-51564_SCH6189132-a TaxID=1834103 RepID=UPI001E47B78B
MKTHNHPQKGQSVKDKRVKSLAKKLKLAQTLIIPDGRMRRSANTHPIENDGAEYQKYLALTFIGTLLSSQRTRT